jgi:hypothetical protein
LTFDPERRDERRKQRDASGGRPGDSFSPARGSVATKVNLEAIARFNDLVHIGLSAVDLGLTFRPKANQGARRVRRPVVARERRRGRRQEQQTARESHPMMGRPAPGSTRLSPDSDDTDRAVAHPVCAARAGRRPSAGRRGRTGRPRPGRSARRPASTSPAGRPATGRRRAARSSPFPAPPGSSAGGIVPGHGR